MRTVAICLSDLHLWHQPPSARAGEKNWQSAMARPLAEVNDLVRQHRVPVLFAGDLTERYNPNPGLINFAIQHLPVMHSVFGQHDLRNHESAALKETAYYTLMQAGKLVNVKPGRPVEVPGAPMPLQLWGFPWGAEVKPCKKPLSFGLDVALIHKYTWRRGCGYDGAPVEARTGKLTNALRGYDVAVVGDNHLPFECMVGSTYVFNCGSVLRRTRAEKDHRPSVGLLMHDSERGAWVERHYLDCSADVLDDAADLASLAPDNKVDGAAFLESLAALGDAAVDFGAALRRRLADGDEPAGVRDLVLKALEEQGDKR